MFTPVFEFARLVWAPGVLFCSHNHGALPIGRALLPTNGEVLWEVHRLLDLVDVVHSTNLILQSSARLKKYRMWV